VERRGGRDHPGSYQARVNPFISGLAAAPATALLPPKVRVPTTAIPTAGTILEGPTSGWSESRFPLLISGGNRNA
jgi:hypothetical protein